MKYQSVLLLISVPSSPLEKTFWLKKNVAKQNVFMPSSAIVGVQFGDEGKGKLVDILAQNADIVVRFCGCRNFLSIFFIVTRTIYADMLEEPMLDILLFIMVTNIR